MTRWKEFLAPLRHRSFRYQYAGFSVSVTGNMLSLVALTVGLVEVTGSGAAAGLALGASTVPLVVFLLVGGVWADRLPRHLVMAGMDVVRGLVQLGLGAMILSGQVNLALLIVVQVVFGTAQAFHLPAATGLTPFTVPKQDLQRANALMSITRSLSGVAGPLIAGGLAATVGAGWALLLDGGTFLVSAWLASRIRVPAAPPRAGGGLLKELSDGFRLVTRTPWIWTSVAGFACTHVAIAVFMVAGPVLALQEQGGAFGWALVVAALGVGDVLGDLVLLAGYRPRRPLLVARLAELLLAPALLLIALGVPAPVQALVIALAGAGMTAADSLWITTMQQHVPEDALSKVSSYDWLSSQALRPAGYALGALAAADGTTATVVLAVMAAVVALPRLVSLAYPSVRELRAPEPEPAPAN
ncbi:MFS transporter [Nonomuraea gerenzanensis]|uniref:COG0477: Permeases of the major facilitator superfamily n=1 Tax=Nonomuraea gerenzanensis TaxID=93944 RepID=A0A1M4ELY1_9ACTN|nr:MFS transporter [Nonomuraea gerenzanensis]UBU11347.1 MFS transporter [Nonomuraea gerenzanensis]SBO99825.1 COG0477: Permeases of the major facilitator superfamily [Nonomuraea gerenzanensis]